MNPSARQLIPVADLGSPALDVPTVLRARQAAAIDAVAENERRIAAHVLAAILDAPPGLSPEGLSAAIAARLSGPVIVTIHLSATVYAPDEVIP